MLDRENELKFLGFCLLLFFLVVLVRVCFFFQRPTASPQIISEPVAAEQYPYQTVDPEQPVDINTADRQTLELLPSIGPVLAERILAYRQENGAFTSVEQLLQIKGIGEHTLEEIREFICIK